MNGSLSLILLHFLLAASVAEDRATEVITMYCHSPPTLEVECHEGRLESVQSEGSQLLGGAKRRQIQVRPCVRQSSGSFLGPTGEVTSFPLLVKVLLYLLNK